MPGRAAARLGILVANEGDTVGDLYYGAARTRIRMDDRTLQHLSAVVTAKLRRNEPFLVSWLDHDAAGDGRSSVWIHAGCDLHYKFASSATIELDRALLEHMSKESSSAHGLRIDDASLRSSAEDAAEG